MAHAALLRALVNQARSLQAGLFKGNNGTACRTLVGARRTGKTTIMRAFAIVAPSAFPGLLPVYLSGLGLMLPQHAVRSAHLPDLLAAAAAARGLAFNGTSLLPVGKRLLLLMDEFDNLYRVPVTEAALTHNVLVSLWALNLLGDHAGGSSSVLLCGSSSSTCRLVQGGSRALDRRFPLALSGIPDLNSEKYFRLRIPSSPCVASHEVRAMMAAHSGTGVRTHAAAARLLTFYLGATPRAVTRALSPGGVSELTGALLAAASPAVPSEDSFEHPGTLHLYAALLSRLAGINAELRALMRKRDGSADFTAIMDPNCHWESVVTPLEWREVEVVYEGAARGAAPPFPPLMQMMDELTDNHLLQLHHPLGGGAAQVWPANAAQVVAGAAGGTPRAADFEGAVAALQLAR